MRRNVAKLALNRETLNNMGLRSVQGGMVGTWNCTHLCSRGCSDGCPSDTGISTQCSEDCYPSISCP